MHNVDHFYAILFWCVDNIYLQEHTTKNHKIY